LFIIAGRAEWDLPIPIQGSTAGEEPTFVSASPSRTRDEFTTRITRRFAACQPVGRAL
jgi:hypothetical protein